MHMHVNVYVMCMCKGSSAGQQQKKGYPKERLVQTPPRCAGGDTLHVYTDGNQPGSVEVVCPVALLLINVTTTYGTVRTRKRTARRSGKLVKRIVAVASLALDGLDLFAHLLSGKVGGATLAIPEGDPRVPVVHHRLGLTEPAVPARVWHGSGVS